MADEIKLNGSIEYEDSEDSSTSMEIANLLATVTTKRFIKYKHNIGTAEEAIKLGELSSLGWAMFVNRDETNFVELRVSTGGAKFAKLFPGEFALLRLASGAQAPYAIADTAACQVDILIIEV